jgi:hypothetical protein
MSYSQPCSAGPPPCPPSSVRLLSPARPRCAPTRIGAFAFQARGRRLKGMRDLVRAIGGILGGAVVLILAGGLLSLAYVVLHFFATAG